jgi:replicative DNA helicase
VLLDTRAPAVPYDLSAEESLIGALLLDREAIIKVEPLVESADFYRDIHGWIYAAICVLYHRREPPDMQTLTSELLRQGQLDAVGGPAYLAKLMYQCPTAVHAEYYARPIAETAARRQQITAGGEIAGLAYQTDLPLEEIQSRAERLLLNITQARRRAAPDITDHSALDAYYQALQTRLAHPGTLVGWSTGLPGLDDLLHGLRPGKLVVITGESGGGKSTVQQAFALALKAAGAAVGFFSLEMPADELAERELAYAARVDSALLAAGDLTPDERGRVDKAFATLLGQVPIRLIPGGGVTLRDVGAQLRRWQTDGGLDAAFLDYLQLVRLPGRDKVGELDELANGLKDLAMELNLSLVTAAQLSKAAVGKDSREWDDYLRGSQAIKQAADIIITVAPQEDRPKDSTQPWRVRLSVTKHRGGPIGDVDAYWWLAYNRIGEAAPRYMEVVR